MSDTHLSPRVPESVANWRAVVAYLDDNHPDLVVNTGDISLDGADERADLEFARAEHDRLTVPWRAIPGNHDVGDAGSAAQPVNGERRARYHELFGSAFWSTKLGRWRLVGIDVQTLMSDEADAPDWWAWLDDELARSGPHALFVHRPLHPFDPAETDEPHRYVRDHAREQMARLLDVSDVRLVASGHVHQWRAVNSGNCSHVWAPSTWAALSDEIQPTIGHKVTGIVEHKLADDGMTTSRLITPAGIAQLQVGREIDSPYRP